MRGLIIECRKRYTVVIDINGDFTRIKNRKDYISGKEIIYSEGDLYRKSRRQIFIAAAAIMLILSMGIGSYALPYGYVDVETDSGISLKTNIYDRVIGIHTEDDIEKALFGLKLKHMNIRDAMNRIIDAVYENGNAQVRETGMAVAVDSMNRKKTIGLEAKLLDSLKKKMDERTEDRFGIIVGALTKDEKDLAEQKKLNQATLLLYKRKLLDDKEARPEDIQKLNSEQIRRIIKEHGVLNGWDIKPRPGPRK